MQYSLEVTGLFGIAATIIVSTARLTWWLARIHEQLALVKQELNHVTARLSALDGLHAPPR